MKIMPLITMTDGQLVSSNVSETDHSEWDVSTTYAAADFVIVLSTHNIYQSVQGSNLGNDPTTDDGTWWTEYSATNRWKVFDSKVADQTTRGTSITYAIAPTSTVTGLAFFNLDAADVRVYVEDDSSPTVTLFDETRELVDDDEIIDWFTYFTIDLTDYQDTAFFGNVPGYVGNTIYIEIGGAVGDAGVGEIAMGRITTLGETLESTEIGTESFSRKEQDVFGNWVIVPRAKSDPITFQFAIPAANAARVKRKLDAVRDTPTVFLADEELVANYGAMTIGFFQDYRIPLTFRGVSTATLEIEGLT